LIFLSSFAGTTLCREERSQSAALRGYIDAIRSTAAAQTFVLEAFQRAFSEALLVLDLPNKNSVQGETEHVEGFRNRNEATEDLASYLSDSFVKGCKEADASGVFQQHEDDCEQNQHLQLTGFGATGTHVTSGIEDDFTNFDDEDDDIESLGD